MFPTRVLCLCATVIGALLFAGCSDSPTVAPTALTSPAGTLAVETAGPTYADVSNQGGGGVYAANGASLLRRPNGLQVSLRMATPAPGGYNYPEGTVAGEPEVFTLWVFIFNNPELCSQPCDSNDLGVDKPARGGAYNGAGHAVGGSVLSLSGRVGVGETPFNHPVITMAPLEKPATAEVHLAVAPHGALDPAKLPNELRIPVGTPPFWWVALFQ